MALYNIINPTKSRRVIHTLLPNAPMVKDDKGKDVLDPLRSHKEVSIEAGATKENVELDDGLVERLKQQAAKIGKDNELQLTPVGKAAATKAA